MFFLNIKEEKMYCYHMMIDIGKERRELTNMYLTLRERLEDLDKLERKGIDQLDMRGYVDMYNEAQSRVAIENIQRESNALINRIQKEAEPEQPKSTIPSHEVAEQRYRDNQNSNIKRSKPVTEEETEIKRPKKQKAKTNKVSRDEQRRRSSMTREETLNIFKDEGIPMNAQAVYDKLKDRVDFDLESNYTIKNFRSNIFFRVTKDDRIEKVSNGYYQYIFNDRPKQSTLLDEDSDTDSNNE